MAKFRLTSMAAIISKYYGYLFLVIGIILIVFSLLYRNYRSRVLSFEGTITETVIQKYPKAVRIIIPDVKIDLPVEEGAVQDGVWSISESGATHLNISENPGGKGNIVIYAHNKNNLFGQIRWLNNGALIKIINENGQEFEYKTNQIVEVKPTELSYVMPKNEEILTLYTCSGFADSKRFIVTAKRVQIQD
jgi:LPXTG-site transpeptidase (sortase) family protein